MLPSVSRRTWEIATGEPPAGVASRVVGTQPAQHLSPEHRISIPARKIARPVWGKIRRENGGTAQPVCPGGDDGIVNMAGDEVGVWLECQPVVAAEGERRRCPIDAAHCRMRCINNLEPESVHQ